MEHGSKDCERNEIKDVTDLMGHYGPWQRNMFIVVLCLGLPAAWNHLIITFYAPKINYWCMPQNGSIDLSVLLTKNYSASDGTRYEQCNFYLPTNGSSKEVEKPCEKWIYDRSFYSRTIIEEWNLVCSRSWLVSLSQFIYMVGYMVGAVVLSQLSDKYGRRPVMLCSLLVLFTSGIVCAFSPGYKIFATCRFFIALGRCGLYITAFVLLMESVGPSYRSILGISRDFGWATGYIMIPGIAWLIRNWFYMQLAITIPVLAFVCMWWILPESPKWLLTQGRLEEAEVIVKKAADMNKHVVQNTEEDLKSVESALCQTLSESSSKANVLDLLRGPTIRKRTLIICFCWFVNSFIFYGLSLNTNDIGGDPFLNFFISGVVEFPAYGMTIIVLRHIGRRMPLMLAMVFGGIACILTIFIPDHLLWLKTTLAMLGKFCITSSYITVYIFSAEIFPTVVRNVGVGTSSVFARIASAVAPFVKELGQATHFSVPLGLFGALSITSGLLALLLPETSKIILPDTLEQVENRGRKKNGDIKLEER